MSICPNAYYNYRKHRKDAKKKTKASILKQIEKIHHESGGKPGYRMMKSLLDNKGIHLSAHTVHKYMNKELGLKSITRRRKRSYSKGPAPYELFDNLLQQDFRADRRNAKWCIDFTYLSFGKNQRRYNCTIIDLYDRRVVASVNSNRINTQLAIDTLSEAIRNSGGEVGVILHSDRGSQYTSGEFRSLLTSNNIKQSLSGVDHCYDNARMESFFATLKKELLYRLPTYKMKMTEVKSWIFRYVFGYYNTVRIYTSNPYGLPPAAYRKTLLDEALAA